MNVTAGRWLRRVALAGLLLGRAEPGAGDVADFDVGLSAFAAGDYATAYKEWSALASQGDVEAQFALGELYERGKGVAANDAKAAEWFAKAADKGHLRSQVKLASLYAEGRGVARDAVKALELWSKAALQGNGTAQVRVAEAYRRGEGVTRDLAIAQEWYRNAADGGDGTARVELFEVAQEIEREAAAAAEMSLESDTPGAEPPDPATTSDPDRATALHVAEAEPTVAVAADDRGAAEETSIAATDLGAAAEIAPPAGDPAEPVVAEDHAPDAAATPDPYEALIATKQAAVLSLVDGAGTEPAAVDKGYAADPQAPVEPAAQVATAASSVAPEPDPPAEPAPLPVQASTTPGADHGSGPVPDPTPVANATTQDGAETATRTQTEELESEATFRVWLASFGDASEAESGWRTLVEHHGDLLAQLTPFVVAPDRDGGEALYRLQAGPFATAIEAQNVCRRLGERDTDCVAVAP